MRLKSYETQLNNLLFKNKIVQHKEQGNIKCYVGSAAGSIPESINGHQPFKGRVKEINNRYDAAFYHV